MAEIRVVEKRSGLAWLWVVLLLLLVALAVWYFVGMRDANEPAAAPADVTPATAPANDPSLPGHPPVPGAVYVRA